MDGESKIPSQSESQENTPQEETQSSEPRLESSSAHKVLELLAGTQAKKDKSTHRKKKYVHANHYKKSEEGIAKTGNTTDVDVLVREVLAGPPSVQRKRAEILAQLEATGTGQEPQVGAEKVQQVYDEVSAKARLFDKCVDYIKRVKDPQTAANIAAVAVGIASMVNDNEHIGALALPLGLAAAGASRYEGFTGKVKGTVAGLTAAAVISKGIDYVPGPQNLIDQASLWVDDAPNAVKVVGFAATQIAKRTK